MYNKDFNEVLFYLSKAKTNIDVLEVWNNYQKELNDKSCIIALEDYESKLTFCSELINRSQMTDSHIISYFKNSNLFFLDREINRNMIDNFLKNEENNFQIDYSIMLDTNYSSYIYQFINGKTVEAENQVYSNIDFLIRSNLNYDNLFYMFENFKHSYFYNKATSQDSISNSDEKLFLNLAALERFKSINRELYINSKKLEYNISEKESFLLADEIWNGFYNSNNELLMQIINFQKHMVLFIIGIIQIRFSNERNIKRKMEMLFEFCDKKSGLYTDREFIVAYEYFKNPTNVQMINKINKGMSQEKIRKSIENIAWDFTIPRFIEMYISTGGNSNFFAPYFVTADRNLKQLFKLYQTKGVIYRKNELFWVPFREMDMQEYLEQDNVYLDYSMFFSEENIQKRHAVFRKNKENNYELINEEIYILYSLLSK